MRQNRRITATAGRRAGNLPFEMIMFQLACDECAFRFFKKKSKVSQTQDKSRTLFLQRRHIG